MELPVSVNARARRMRARETAVRSKAAWKTYTSPSKDRPHFYRLCRASCVHYPADFAISCRQIRLVSCGRGVRLGFLEGIKAVCRSGGFPKQNIEFPPHQFSAFHSLSIAVLGSGFFQASLIFAFFVQTNLHVSYLVPFVITSSRSWARLFTSWLAGAQIQTRHQLSPYYIKAFITEYYLCPQYMLIYFSKQRNLQNNFFHVVDKHPSKQLPISSTTTPTHHTFDEYTHQPPPTHLKHDGRDRCRAPHLDLVSLPSFPSIHSLSLTSRIPIQLSSNLASHHLVPPSLLSHIYQFIIISLFYSTSPPASRSSLLVSPPPDSS